DVEQVTLSATNGKLKLGTTAGITFNSGANNSSAMTISGTLASLNNALKNLTFTPLTGYVGSASIALSYTDVGNSLTASASIAITVGNAATVQGGSTKPQVVGSVTSPPTNSSDDSDNQTQWAGFAAALETLSS